MPAGEVLNGYELCEEIKRHLAIIPRAGNNDDDRFFRRVDGRGLLIAPRTTASPSVLAAEPPAVAAPAAADSRRFPNRPSGHRRRGSPLAIAMDGC